METRQSGPITGLVIGGLLLVGGFFLAYRIGKPIRDRAVASVAWPTAEGRITGSRVERVKNGGDGKATVGTTSFALVTKGTAAWVKNAAEDAAFVEAIRRGQQLTVEATSRMSLAGPSPTLPNSVH